MPIRGRRAVSALLVVATAVAPLGHGHAATLSRAEYDSCQNQNEGAFRAAITRVSVKSLQAGLASIDYRATVADEWRRSGLDDIIDKRVDIAVEEVSSETGLGALLKSLADQQKAQELARAVTERVYRSDTVKAGIEALATGVGKEVGRRMELASEDAAEPTIACLKSFVGSRYGDTIAAIVTGDVGPAQVDPNAGEGGVTPGAVLKEASGGIAGMAVLLMRRQLANMAGRIGQRIVGSVLSRLVSVVAGGVGLVLIAKDLWDLRNGVLPIIATEMKSKETKAKVQEELAKVLSEQIEEHVKEIGAKSAERVVEIWQEFRRAHASVLSLADRNPKFKAFLDGLKPAMLPRLDEVVAIDLGNGGGEAAVLNRLNDGSLQRAVIELSPDGMQIAREMRSIDVALAWTAVAQDLLPRVVDRELHKRASPGEFTRVSLQRLLAIDDRIAETRLAGVGRDVRDVLFELDATELRSLARSLSEGELTTLARYLSGLERTARERVLRTVAATPSKMQRLAPAHIRDAILASGDQGAAVDMMLRSDEGLGSPAVFQDAKAVWQGRIAPVLLWEKHPVLVGALALTALLLLLALKRLLLPRRRPPNAPPAAEPAKTTS